MSDEADARKVQIRALFDRLAPDYDLAGPGCFAHFGRRLVELADIEPGGRVLDVATGRGAVLVPAAERAGPAGQVVGIDLAEEMVHLAREAVARAGLAAEVRVMDAERLDFPDASFDHLLCGFGVMFFPDLPRALGEFRRVLRPGGRLGLSAWRVTQADDLAVVLTQEGAMPTEPDPAKRFGELEALERPLQEAGFAEVRALIDEATFRYADLAQYWQNARGTGLRRWLDALDADGQARVEAALAERLHPRADGLDLAASAVLVTAARPG